VTAEAIPDLTDPEAVGRALAPRTGGPVRDLTRLPGHSGYSYAFRSGDGRRLVARFGPRGVRSEGADVLRQAPVLRAAHAAGVPVPAVIWAGPTDPELEADCLVVDFVSGRSLPDLFDPAAGPPEEVDVSAVFRDAAAVLARVHGAPWRPEHGERTATQSFADVVEMLVPALEREEDADVAHAGLELGARLLATQPTDPRIGLVHNDYYSNNWILAAEEPRIAAVLDWETACIGPVGMDLGWFAMMSDPAAWSPQQRPGMGWLPDPEEVIAAYARAGGEVPAEIAWYRAFAGFRLVAGISYYLRLHRRGRRPDDTWEGFALSVPALLGRATALLDG
jgi:aminoglycoside phosphotransferase (APT) family kinase protein